MFDQSEIVRAARNILVHSLELNRDQNLLIFADAGSLAVAETIAQSARPLDIAVSTIYVSHFTQANFEAWERLPHPVEAALPEADAILNCLSDRPEHMAYRLRVLSDGWRRHNRLAHMPGVTLDILRMADTDYDQIHRRCLSIATALVLGREMEILTYDSTGAEHRLLAQLSGWEYSPGISNGIIAKGSWANLPPGETFVVPVGAEGSIAINGSIPGRVLTGGETLQIHFERGRVKDVQPSESSAAQFLTNTQIAYAQRRSDANWRNLAEIGFGLNEAVRSLSGVGLIDEKKAGTIHVALGSSKLLGGRVDSVIHCDLVIEGATVYVDGLPILVDGQWALRKDDWQIDHRSIELPAGWWESVRTLHLSGSRYDWNDGHLVRYWSSRSGQQNALRVGVTETGLLAGRLLNLLNDQVGALIVDDLFHLADAYEIPADEVPSLVRTLHRYDLVRVQGENGK